MLEIAEITDFLETGEVPDKKQFVIGATAGLKLSKIQKDMLAGAVLEKVRHRMLASTYATSSTVDDWNEIFSWSDKKSPGHLDLLELRAVCRGPSAAEHRQQDLHQVPPGQELRRRVQAVRGVHERQIQGR
jgi:hypothetical protein